MEDETIKIDIPLDDIDNVDTNDDLLLDDLDVTMDLSDIVEDTTNDSDE